MTDRHPHLDQLDVLVGMWDTEITHRLIEGSVRGSTSYEWLAGGRFLIQRSHVDDDRFPDAIAIIGPPAHGDGLVLEWFDQRGVRRTYDGVEVRDGVLRYRLDQPGFDQRFEARLGGDEFVGVGQLAETPGSWVDDIRIVFRRRA
jgi:hypothetical protein